MIDRNVGVCDALRNARLQIAYDAIRPQVCHFDGNRIRSRLQPTANLQGERLCTDCSSIVTIDANASNFS